MGLSRRDFLRVSAAAATGATLGCARGLQTAAPLPRYGKALTLGPGEEWRFYAVLLVLARDGRCGLAAAARLWQAGPPILAGGGRGRRTPPSPAWPDIGHGA